MHLALQPHYNLLWPCEICCKYLCTLMASPKHCIGKKIITAYVMCKSPVSKLVIICPESPHYEWVQHVWIPCCVVQKLLFRAFSGEIHHFIAKTKWLSLCAISDSCLQDNGIGFEHSGKIVIVHDICNHKQALWQSWWTTVQWQGKQSVGTSTIRSIFGISVSSTLLQ